MYALSITMMICLISIGGYFAVQRGLCMCFVDFFRTRSNRDEPNATYNVGGFPHKKSNIIFNKLEDEQSIIRHEFEEN